MDKEKFEVEVIKSINTGNLTDYASECITEMIKGIVGRYQYKTAEEKEYVSEQTTEAIEKHWNKFPLDKGANAFSYYVQIGKCAIARAYTKYRRQTYPIITGEVIKAAAKAAEKDIRRPNYIRLEDNGSNIPILKLRGKTIKEIRDWNPEDGGDGDSIDCHGLIQEYAEAYHKEEIEEELIKFSKYLQTQWVAVNMETADNMVSSYLKKDQ